MYNSIGVDFGSFHVMQLLHTTFKLHSRLATSWEPHAIAPGGSAYVLHAQGHGIAFTRACWGRSGVDADRRYMDKASPALVRRGIIFASSVNMTALNAARTWGSKPYRIGMPGPKFIMLGCRLDTGPNGPEFALLGATASMDLAANFSTEPVIVPESYLSEWLNPSSSKELSFPKRPGTLSMTPT